MRHLRSDGLVTIFRFIKLVLNFFQNSELGMSLLWLPGFILNFFFSASQITISLRSVVISFRSNSKTKYNFLAIRFVRNSQRFVFYEYVLVECIRMLLDLLTTRLMFLTVSLKIKLDRVIETKGEGIFMMGEWSAQRAIILKIFGKTEHGKGLSYSLFHLIFMIILRGKKYFLLFKNRKIKSWGK